MRHVRRRPRRPFPLMTFSAVFLLVFVGTVMVLEAISRG